MLSSAAHEEGLRGFFDEANADEKAREAMDLSRERGGFLSLQDVSTPKELLDYRGRCDALDGDGAPASAPASRPSAALAERLALPALYSGMAGVASAMLGSLEGQFGAAPGSLSGLMDVSEDGNRVLPPGSPLPVRPDCLLIV